MPTAWARRLFQLFTFSSLLAALFLTDGANASTARRGAIGGLQASSIQRRVPQTVWDSRVNKGRYLNCLFPLDIIAAGNIGAPQSQYTTHAQAEQFGWWHNEPHANTPQLNHLTAAAAHWNIDLSAAAVEYCGWLHLNDYDHPTAGADTEATMGNYQNVFSARSGFFIADNNYSPEEMNRQDRRPDRPVPPMARFSDMVFVQWQEQCAAAPGCQLGSIRLILRHHIVYPPSFSIVIAALRRRGIATIPQFANREVLRPGDPDEGFFAILGEAHGAGAAYFLIQHKAQLGLKRITSFTVWANVAGHSTQTDWSRDNDPDLMVMVEVQNA